MSSKTCNDCVYKGFGADTIPCDSCISRHNWRRKEDPIVHISKLEIAERTIRDLSREVNQLRDHKRMTASEVRESQRCMGWECGYCDKMQERDAKIDDLNSRLRGLHETHDKSVGRCEDQALHIKSLKDDLRRAQANLTIHTNVQKSQIKDLQRQLGEKEQMLSYHCVGKSPGRCEGCTHVEVLEKEKEKLQRELSTTRVIANQRRDQIEHVRNAIGR